jgi:hypothetical protein
VSLTGLSAQQRAATEEIIAYVGQAQRMSLTGLERGVRRIMRKTLGEVFEGSGNFGTQSAMSLTGLGQEPFVIAGESTETMRHCH